MNKPRQGRYHHSLDRRTKFMNVISIGEVLWDVFGEKEFLGGAALNFAIHLRRLGHTVFFVSGIGQDERGKRIVHQLEVTGLCTEFLSSVQNYPTGWVDVMFDSAGEPSYQIHHPVAFDFPELSERQFRELFSSALDWIYFGTLQQMSPVAKKLTDRLIGEAPAAKLFYDPNLRLNSYSPEVVRGLLEKATIVKLNEGEAGTISSMYGQPGLSLEEFCRSFTEKFRWEAVAITRGAAGCVMLLGNEYVEAGGYEVTVADPVGAGDAFAAAFLHGIAAGWAALQVADFANRVAALVASRAGGAPAWAMDEANALLPRKSKIREIL
jgi:fructokinase